MADKSVNDEPKLSEIQLRAVALIDESDVAVENHDFDTALCLLGKAAFLCPDLGHSLDPRLAALRGS